jgi:hypothetical protein
MANRRDKKLYQKIRIDKRAAKTRPRSRPMAARAARLAAAQAAAAAAFGGGVGGGGGAGGAPAPVDAAHGDAGGDEACPERLSAEVRALRVMDFAARLRFANRATRQVFSRYVCVRHFAASTAAAMRCACGGIGAPEAQKRAKHGKVLAHAEALRAAGAAPSRVASSTPATYLKPHP